MKKNLKNNKRNEGRSTKNEEGGTKKESRTSYLVPPPSYLLFLLLFVFGCSHNETAHQDIYTCPMHHTVISDRPGNCPVCGMELVLKIREGEEVKITEDLAKLIKSPNEVVVSSINTIKGEFKSMPVKQQAEGMVTYDPRYLYTIPARIGGRLEKVYLKSVFQTVQKGQKVADIYSPELLTAQRELLYLVENDANNVDLIESSKNKLYLLGATKAQVEEIIKRKESMYTFSIYSPYDGYVVPENQQAPVITTTAASASKGSGMGDSGMGASSGASAPASAMNNTSRELTREGNYVSTGQTLFTIVNTSALRIELNLPASQGSSLKIKNEIELILGSDRKEKAVVDFIQPFFSKGEAFVKVRVYVNNTSDLRIGQLVNATIQLPETEALWLPREAVFDTGMDKIVFIKDREAFKPKKIITGIQTDGWIEIKQGLSTSEEVARNAQYLVDSESFIKSK